MSVPRFRDIHEFNHQGIEDWHEWGSTFRNGAEIRSFPLFSLPGEGEPGKNCTEKVPYRCLDCERIFWRYSDCNQRDCPRCYGKWARIEAKAMKGRLWDGRARYGKKLRIHHVIISFRPDTLTDIKTLEFYCGLREWAYRLVLDAGAIGGCIVFHPWREGNLKWDGSILGQYNVAGPHFHLFVLSEWLKPGDEVVCYYEGVIMKRIHGFNAKLLRPFEYALKHCGIAKGTHAVVWFGDLAYNKMDKGNLEISAREGMDKPVICPHCGSENTEFINVYDIPRQRESG